MIKVLLFEKCPIIRKHLAIALNNDPFIEVVACCTLEGELMNSLEIFDVDIALITTAHPCYKRLTAILVAEYTTTRIVGIPRKGFSVNPNCLIDSGTESFVCRKNANASEIVEDLKYVHYYQIEGVAK